MWKKARCAVTAMAMIVMLSACATERARHVKPSGFLKDYSLLKKTEGDKAQLLYINEKVDWKKYDKIIIEPVTIWRVPGSKLEKAPQNELDMLGRYFYTAIRNELAKDYTIVDEPEVGAMRFRLALTEAQKSKVVLDIVSSVIPIGAVVSVGKRLATGTHSFVGKATVEAELSSATTGELLAGAVASRVGGKGYDAGMFSSWSDVKKSADHWAARLRESLAGLREKDANR